MISWAVKSMKFKVSKFGAGPDYGMIFGTIHGHLDMNYQNIQNVQKWTNLQKIDPKIIKMVLTSDLVSTQMAKHAVLAS